MSHKHTKTSRRQFLQSAAFGTALFTTPGLFAEQLAATPRMTEGPFYPDKLPLDTDNDLLIINDGITPAVGEITHVSRASCSVPRASRFAMHSSRSGSAMPTGPTSTQGQTTARIATATFRGMAGF